MKLSLVIPVYNEAGSLPQLAEEIEFTLAERGGDSEIIFVDDGSTDGTPQVLADLRKKNPKIRIVRLRRNFGKAAALQCGFRRARGDVVITMDADLQDDPREIPRFLAKLGEGYDLVSGWKRHRKDPLSKRIPSKIYNTVTSWVTGVRLRDFNCGFKAYRRDLLKEIDVYGELHRYIPVLAGWRGFKVAELDVHHRARVHGKSKFNSSRYLAGLLDLATAFYVTRFSAKPSRIFGGVGLLFFTAGSVIDFHIVWIKAAGGFVGDRTPYMMCGILLTLLGIQFVFVGLLSELIVFFYHRFKREYSVEHES